MAVALGEYELIREPVAVRVAGVVFSDDEKRGALRSAVGSLRNATGAVMTGVRVSIDAEGVEGDRGALARPKAASTAIAGTTVRMTANEATCSATFSNLRVAPGESVAIRLDGIDAGGADMLAISMQPLFGGATR